MSTPEDRLGQAGQSLPEMATPVAASTPALCNGPYVCVSRQPPML